MIQKVQKAIAMMKLTKINRKYAEKAKVQTIKY